MSVTLWKDLGLVDGRVSTVESASVPAGMVVELSPEKGSTDDKGAQTVEAGSTASGARKRLEGGIESR